MTLEDAIENDYIISLKQEPEATDESRQQKFQTLIDRVHGMQQQYAGQFNCYRRFNYVKAVAAVIKDAALVDLLAKEGYVVEKQGVMTSESQ